MIFQEGKHININSLNIIKLGFIGLFLISIFIFYFFLRPGEYSIQDLWKSIFLTIPIVIYILVRSPKFFSENYPRGFYTILSLPIAAFTFFIITFAALSIDLDSLRLVRTVSREEDLFLRIINLHLVLFFFLCVYHYSNKLIGKNQGRFLLLLGFIISMIIAYYEGRRTAAIIPILLVSVFSLTQGKSFSKRFNKILLFFTIFFVIFSFVTLIRVPDLSFEFIVKAVFSRLFNPGYVILEIMHQQDYQFLPETISNSLNRIGYILGLNVYEGSTNEFGRYYGFLAPDNFFVGINPGIIVESFLSFGWFYIIPIILLFEFSFIILNIYRKLVFGSDIFIAILIVHGMQMEIPYLFGLLTKLAIVGALLKLLTFFLPRQEVKRGVS